MLLYAGGHASFVVDAYTKRIFTRHHWWGAKTRGKSGKGNTADEYAALQNLCEASLDHLSAVEKLDYWQDYHAQLVMVGKHYCRNRQPDCEHCPLKPLLPK
jgi:endonuclease-3 related protein